MRLEDHSTSSTLLRQNGVYLITGGLGGIGLGMAEHIARSVKAKLVLVGRSKLPPRSEWEALLAGQQEDGKPWTDVTYRIRKIQLLEDLGAEVVIATADVADQDQIQKVIA